MDDLQLLEISNLAQFLAMLIGSFSLSLSMLKVVEFHRLGSKSILFFRIFFRTLFTKTESSDLENVFQRIAEKSDFSIVRQNILFFLNTAFLTKEEARTEKDLSKRITSVRKLLIDIL